MNDRRAVIVGHSASFDWTAAYPSRRQPIFARNAVATSQPLATQAGWNYRDASIGAPDRLAGEIGSYIPFARTKAEREKTSDPRLSIEERYRSLDEYVGKFAAVTLDLVQHGYLLREDVADLLKHAVEHYQWATQVRATNPE